MIKKTYKKKIVFFAAVFTLALTFIAYAQTPSWETRANERQSPDKVMDSIGLKPGMVIGEIGAGRGRYTVFLAERVGDTGKVYANDINERGLTYLRERCQNNDIKNVETILGEVDDPLFPDSSLDMAFMVWVYHHLEEPVSLLKNLRPSLKQGATLVIIDPAPERGGEKDSEHVTTKARLAEHGKKAGYEVFRVETFLPQDNIFILIATK
jgi:ubiquinone/menaquinone biosynthesis C-methylase UbiE